MKTVYKVRALVLDKKGRAYGITGDADHVLQLPGGSRKASECPVKALHREMREELGYRVKVLGTAGDIKVKRNGVREVTTCYVVRITGGKGKPKLTGREKARGLKATRYESPKALRKALSERVTAYGRTAARRDLKLTTAALKAV